MTNTQQDGRLRARHAALALLVATSASPIACDRAAQPEPVANADPTDPSIAQVLFGVRQNVTVGGVRRAQLRADTALAGDSATRIEFRGVRLVLYSPAGDSVGAMAAPAATYDLRTRQLTARGGVTLLTAGRRTSAPEVAYDATTGKWTPRGPHPADAENGPARTRP